MGRKFDRTDGAHCGQPMREICVEFDPRRAGGAGSYMDVLQMIARLRSLIAVLAIVLPTASLAGFREDQATCNAAVHTDLNEAVAACTRQIHSGRWKGKDLAVSYNNRGNAYRDNGEFDLALADFNTAIRLAPTYYLPYNNRGILWRERGQLDRALADYGDAIRLNPSFAFPYNNRAIVWRDKGEFDRAIADFSEAIRRMATYGNAYANRGESWRLKGDLDRAVADQDQAVRLSPRATAAWFQRGETLRYKGEFARAIADFDTALSINPEYVPALTGRGLTYEKMGDFARARAEFEKALASQSQLKSDLSASARETARARLAALDSGAPQPIIPAAPSKVGSATSIPTPTVAAPAAPAAVASQGRRVALVIGNTAYQKVSALANPQRDAESVAAALRGIGFEVVTLATDATREKLVEALREFADEAEKADWAMVYYAGHGVEVGGVNYLIPVDAKLAVDRDVQFEAVPLDQVLAAVEQAKKLKLIVLDACRDNPFVPQMRRTSAPDAVAAAPTGGGAITTRTLSSRGLGEVKVSGATLVVYAAKHGQIALDGEGGNSPFAAALVQRVATPGVELFKVFRLIRDDVMEATAGRQEPYTYGSLPGREDFFFVAGR